MGNAAKAMTPGMRRAEGPRLLTSERLTWGIILSGSRAVQLQALRSVPLHLEAGRDIRRSLERLAVELMPAASCSGWWATSPRQRFNVLARQDPRF